MRVHRIVLPAALLLALAACNRQPPAQTPQQPSRPTPRTASDVLPSSDPRMLRFHKVDMLIAQWDVAQAGGRNDQADQLFQQIRMEVDAAFPDFVAASRGQYAVQLQYVAVGGLGFSGRSEATRALLDRLADTDPQLVGNALIALKLKADPDTPLAPLLKHVTAGAPAPRRYAPLAIANVVDARYRTGRSVDPEMQRAATHVLSGVVADRDPFVRLHVAKALGALRTPGTYELLMILMRDEQVRIRLAAAAGLERLADPRGFPETIRLLADTPDDLKPLVRDVLASYASRLQGGPLSESEIQQLGVSHHAWNRWFSDYATRHDLQLEEGRAAGAPPGVTGKRPPGTTPPTPGTRALPPSPPPATRTMPPAAPPSSTRPPPRVVPGPRVPVPPPPPPPNFPTPRR